MIQTGPGQGHAAPALNGAPGCGPKESTPVGRPMGGLRGGDLSQPGLRTGPPQGPCLAGPGDLRSQHEAATRACVAKVADWSQAEGRPGLGLGGLSTGPGSALTGTVARVVPPGLGSPTVQRGPASLSPRSSSQAPPAVQSVSGRGQCSMSGSQVAPSEQASPATVTITQGFPWSPACSGTPRGLSSAEPRWMPRPSLPLCPWC